MKALRIIGHPILLVCMYLLLITEGDNFGGLYVMYLILSLPHAVPFAIIATVGILIIILSYNQKPSKYPFLRPCLYFVGYILMILSLVTFFSTGNEWATFETIVPLLTFIVFGILSVFFLINTVSLLIHGKHREGSNVRTVSS